MIKKKVIHAAHMACMNSKTLISSHDISKAISTLIGESTTEVSENIIRSCCRIHTAKI